MKTAGGDRNSSRDDLREKNKAKEEREASSGSKRLPSSMGREQNPTNDGKERRRKLRAEIKTDHGGSAGASASSWP